ncbi:flagellar biosynthesis protein FlhB [Desulfosporosinus sp.]|uniref:flagellar biosynthesis protein FlhB n=1 Tax=Desulfosporosinus sp. TaxID=157907 RepID=UPI000E9EA4FA|nr:flagellar biosynthesis protein FlhB [Desulfosporosinus sp.]MBC2721926.1 flagellar biosynthesis protein FlhB [Desulfosporosinus sp.]MBC2728871.1 flagellar biosynthesis protein FlhB [Desulfosporosinus sp.]HBV85999.1 flagellar biosynthesis protein FlhB [Desulfosporosinus sp.]
MSEKKHPATPRRKEEARKKGQVFKSQEVISALMLLGLVAVLRFWIPAMLTRIEYLFPYVLGLSAEWNERTVASLMLNTLWIGIQIMAPIFGTAFVIALISNYIQVGVLFTGESMKPQLSRLSLISGAKRMFGVKAWVELAKSLMKVILIGYFLYASVRDRLHVYPALQQLNVGQGAIFLAEALMELAWNISLSFLGIAAFDYIYQRWDYEKNLRMSHEDLKQEYKQTEGNPELKSELKKRQRAMAMSRMMQDMKQADVVVTNPTHYAVALRYDQKVQSAPYVVAKGQDQVALKMRELAKEYDLVIMENKPLARALYAQVDIGQGIPADLYKAVAEVLAFVYRLKKKKKRA